jgi:hypothetical protein
LNRVWQHSYDITNNQNSSENNCFIKILAKNRHKSIKALEISVVGSFESVESWVDYIHIGNFIAFAGFMYYIKLILDDAIKKQQPDFFEVR